MAVMGPLAAALALALAGALVLLAPTAAAGRLASSAAGRGPWLEGALERRKKAIEADIKAGKITESGENVVAPTVGPADTAAMVEGGVASLSSGGPVAVDFYVFLGDHAGEKQVAPQASVNIFGENIKIGFFPLCKKECPTAIVDVGQGVTAPRMRFCRCIAELMVKDLALDFGTLLDPAKGEGNSSMPSFEMGAYEEVTGGQRLFDIKDGHGVLHELMGLAPSEHLGRKPGRVSVWIAHFIAGNQPNTELAGTTYLDQTLYAGAPGAGVLLMGSVGRTEKRLSHEVGHVVGFHHVAGGQVQYTYEHRRCPACGTVLWETVPAPSCDMNIMGSWYDGPFCCPWKEDSLAQKAKEGRRSEISILAIREPQCLANSLSHLQDPYCCGPSCRHNCPKTQPALSFATSMHRDVLSRIFGCWLRLRGAKPDLALLPAGSGSATAASPRPPVVCSDYPEALGSCSQHNED